MKIALVSSEYPPFRGGGIGAYTHTLSRALVQLGHQVHVVCNGWEGAGGVERQGLLTVHRLTGFDRDYAPSPGLPSSLEGVGRGWILQSLWSALAAKRLDALFEAGEVELAEFPECFAEGYVSLARRRWDHSAHRLPITITLHSPMAEIAQYNGLLKRERWVRRAQQMEDFCIRHAHGLTSPSSLLLQRVSQRLGVDFAASRPSGVVPNPLDPWWLAPPPTLSEVRRILFVGRLEPRKGPEAFVRAAIELMRRGYSFEAMLVGRDQPLGEGGRSMREHLGSLIPPALSSSFTFLPLQSRESLRSLYRSAMATVFPPPWDNYPYTCAEALASGAAVVGTDASGMRQMLQDGGGLLVPPGELQALVGAVGQLLDSPGLRRAVREGGRARIASLSDPKVVVPQRLAHYEQVRDAVRRASPRKVTVNESKTQHPPRVAALLRTDGADPSASVTTLDLQRTAAEAGVGLTVWPAQTDGEWAEALSQAQPDFLLCLREGDRLEPPFLPTCLKAMRDERVGWATTWSESTPSPELPYAGWDFVLPLDLIDYRPPPFALIRGEAFRQVGGWNLDLPLGWREWDLWLTLAQRGWEGVVIPSWMGRHLTTPERKLTPDLPLAVQERVWEVMVARNRTLFQTHGPELWLALQLERGRAQRERPSRTLSSQRVVFDFLDALASAVVQAPAGYVGQAAFFDQYPEEGEGLLAHPPSVIAYEVDIPERCVLTATLGLHPSTYEQSGGAVRFLLRVEGRTVLDQVLDPKRVPEHRGPRPIRLPLDAVVGERRRIVFETQAVPEDRWQFCTAGWGRARLIVPENR